MNRPTQLDIISHTAAMTPDSDERLVHDDDDDDDSSSSYSDEDRLSSIHNIQKKNSSIRRTDSWQSFVTRSERNSILGKDKPPSEEEARRRKVHFHDNSSLECVHEIDYVPDDIKPSYYMTESDFERFDKELALTRFRWENHKQGKIKFDEKMNSVRGLERVLDIDQDAERCKWQHVRSVLEKQNDMKMSGKKDIDWETVRETSLKTSSEFSKHAVAMGKADEEAHHRAWSEKTESSESLGEPSTKKDKKKSGRGLFFWKKSSS